MSVGECLNCRIDYPMEQVYYLSYIRHMMQNFLVFRQSYHPIKMSDYF